MATKPTPANDPTELAQYTDSEWLKSTFIIKDTDIVSGNEYGKFIRKNRYYTTADFKFTSTSPGMSLAVNPKPQFTRYCDPRSKGKIRARPDVKVDVEGHSAGLGMGHFYSEAYDDNEQRIYLSFGHPKYMPFLVWLSRAFDIDKAIFHNRGVITTTLLEAVGAVSKFFAIATAPLLGFGMFFAGALTMESRFYSVNQQMYSYWATVENILNTMVARRTLVPYMFQNFTMKQDNTMNREMSVNKKEIETLNNLLPDVVDPETGRISVFALALRGQAAYNRVKRREMEEVARGGNPALDFYGYPLKGETSHDTTITNRLGNTPNFAAAIFKVVSKIAGDQAVDGSPLDQTGAKSQQATVSYDDMYTDKDGKPITLDLDPNDPNDTVDKRIAENVASKRSTFEKYREYLASDLADGSAFAIFNVDSTGSVGESFSNSSGANPIESTFNAISSKFRNVTNFLSSATDLPVVGDVMKFAADAGATILSDASFGLANPLLALAYGVNITMPKVWESSSANLPKANYKVKLNSPYGNAYSQLFNIYLPLAMLMAGSLPRSTGSSSYTSPFVCRLFDRGRVNIALGMIDNISITRGTSNLPFSRNGHPNAIDVEFSIANMDEVVAVDVNSNGVLSRVLSALNPNFADTPLTTYINTITAVDPYTQYYTIQRLRVKLAERMMTLKTIINPDPAALAAFTVGSNPVGQLIKAFTGDNQAALQSLVGR